jgi:hypothetical protein
MGNQYSSEDIHIMLGLDDLAHNRLGTMEKDGTFVPVSNYGQRNYKEKCYCAILKRLGVKRGR